MSDCANYNAPRLMRKKFDFGGGGSRIVWSGRIPLLVRRGGCGINKKSRSHRSAADGVVAHTQMFQNAFRNVTRERPPHPRLFGRGPFFNGAATPPLQGGEYARLNSFTASIPHWKRRDRMRIATWLWTVLTLGVAFAFGVAPAGAQ